MNIKIPVLAIFLFLLGLSASLLTLGLVVKTQPKLSSAIRLTGHEVTGFLPYWMIDKADKNYSKYLTTLTYFGISVGPDGSLVKLSNPREEEPGWYTLTSGKADGILNQAKKDNVTLSLLLFSGDQTAIESLISDPASHAAEMVSEAGPVMKKYGFTDLNLDIESVTDATDGARENFTEFVRQVREKMSKENLGTLTLESSPTDFIKKRLIDPAAVAPLVDKWVLMSYDFHYQGSAVTGPVSPVGGAGIDSELDSETGVQKAVAVMPPDKIFFGAPLYGYEWETVGNLPRSAVVPQSGQVASNRRVETFLGTCASCSAKTDLEAGESYLIYHDDETGTYHQIFFPDKNSMAEKINLTNRYGLGGIALWALGYDGETILDPLASYRK